MKAGSLAMGRRNMSLDRLRTDLKVQMGSFHLSQLGFSKNSKKNFFSKMEEILIENLDEEQPETDKYTQKWDEHVRILRTRQRLKIKTTKGGGKAAKRNKIKRKVKKKKVNIHYK